MIHVDGTVEERCQWLAIEIEHTRCLLRDARKCRLPQLAEQRRQRIIVLEKELRRLSQSPRTEEKNHV